MNNNKVKTAILLLIIVAILSACNNAYNWGWYAVSPFTKTGKINLSFLISGLIPTMYISVMGYMLSISLGLIVAIVGKLNITGFSLISRTHIVFFRSVPVLVLILWIYYGLPIVSHISISVFSAALISMALCESAFVAEIFRTGIEAISKSQVESAYVMGANTFQVYLKIILPQVFRKMLPALTNQLVYMIKISSLASIIGFEELTRKSNELNVTKQRPLEIYTILIIEYLVLILIVTFIEKLIVSKVGPSYDD